MTITKTDTERGGDAGSVTTHNPAVTRRDELADIREALLDAAFEADQARPTEMEIVVACDDIIRRFDVLHQHGDFATEMAQTGIEPWRTDLDADSCDVNGEYREAQVLADMCGYAINRFVPEYLGDLGTQS